MMKTISKMILPIALALGIGVTSASALTEEGKVFRNFIFREAIKSQINPDSRETNVNVYQQPQQNNQYREYPSSATGNIQNVWTEYGVYKEGEKGMVIHTKLNINNHQGKPAKISAFFHYRDGRKLLDKDNSYSIDGQVAVSNTHLKPGYKNSTYEDIEMFIPTSQLDIKEIGKHELKFHVGLFDTESQRKLAGSSWKYITLTKNQNTVKKKVLERRVQNKSQYTNNNADADDKCMDKCYTLFKKKELKEGMSFFDCVESVCK